MNCSDQLSEILSCLLNNYFLLNLAVVSSSQQLLENSVCLQPIFESLLMHNKLFESLMCNWRALVTMRRKIKKFDGTSNRFLLHCGSSFQRKTLTTIFVAKREKFSTYFNYYVKTTHMHLQNECVK